MKNLTIKAKLFIILAIGTIGSLLVGITVNNHFGEMASQNPEIASALSAINWYIAILILIDATVVVYVVKQINVSLENMQKGLGSFFDYLNHKTDKFDLIDIHMNDELGKLSVEINKEALKTKDILTKDKIFVEDVQAVMNNRNKGMGLNNMITRAKSVNGSCIIKSEPSQGISVIVDIKF